MGKLKPSEVRRLAREEARAARAATGRKTEDGGRVSVDTAITAVLNGVTVSWFAQALQMDPTTVRKKLAGCPYETRHGGRGQHLYQLHVALPYLVKPQVDMAEYLKTVKATDLPVHLQKDFWTGMNARQKWEENAGDLWRTSAVMDVLGQVFQTVKFTTQLWADTLERNQGLTVDQYQALRQLTRALQEDIFLKLTEVGMPDTVKPQLAEMDQYLQASPRIHETEDDAVLDIDDVL